MKRKKAQRWHDAQSIIAAVGYGFADSWLGSRDGQLRSDDLAWWHQCWPVSIAGGIDFLSATSQKQAMQAAADSAAIAAVREASLKGLAARFGGGHHLQRRRSQLTRPITPQKAISAGNLMSMWTGAGVTVVIEQDHYPYFFARAFPTTTIEGRGERQRRQAARISV